MPAESSSTPVSEFFKPYTNYGFHYNPLDSANDEFRRLSKRMKWWTPKGQKPSLANRIARFQFAEALAQQFGESFGRDVGSLDSWQSLCAAVYIDPVPDTLEQAQIAFERTHVNLVELTECYRSKREIRRFQSVEALSAYTRAKGLYFPRARVKEGSLLCYLLRHINNPEIDDKSLQNGGRRVAGGNWRGRNGVVAGTRGDD